MTKTRIAIFFGGKSAEHEVSIKSAKNILQAIDTEQFEPILIGIDRSGNWHQVQVTDLIADQSEHVIINASAVEEFQCVKSLNIDVAFPILHGPMGEDGTIQGFFELIGIPYVGPGVLAAAISMDKDFTKRLLRDAGILTAPYVVLQKHEEYDAGQLQNKLGNVLFVKPANMGSSVGVSRVETEQALRDAISKAFEYDTKVLIESAITGDEIECAVLGNEQPQASAIGRVVPTTHSFYDYDAKYIDADGAALEMPAYIPESAAEQAQQTALLTYKTLGCEGMARVDMFLTDDGNIIVNEVNTLPGFTNISMYPKLWEISGLPYADLISRLIELAQQRHKTRSSLKTSR